MAKKHHYPAAPPVGVILEDKTEADAVAVPALIETNEHCQLFGLAGEAVKAFNLLKLSVIAPIQIPIDLL